MKGVAETRLGPTDVLSFENYQNKIKTLNAPLKTVKNDIV